MHIHIHQETNDLQEEKCHTLVSVMRLGLVTWQDVMPMQKVL